jgi:hypothetical protein
LSLAEVNKPDDVVDVAVSQHGGLDGAMAVAVLGIGPQLRCLVELLTQIR